MNGFLNVKQTISEPGHSGQWVYSKEFNFCLWYTIINSYPIRGLVWGLNVLVRIIVTKDCKIFAKLIQHDNLANRTSAHNALSDWFSQKYHVKILLCYHWLSLTWKSKTMHCGTLYDISLTSEFYPMKLLGSTYLSHCLRLCLGVPDSLTGVCLLGDFLGEDRAESPALGDPVIELW